MNEESRSWAGKRILTWREGWGAEVREGLHMRSKEKWTGIISFSNNSLGALVNLKCESDRQHSGFAKHFRTPTLHTGGIESFLYRRKLIGILVSRFPTDSVLPQGPSLQTRGTQKQTWASPPLHRFFSYEVPVINFETFLVSLYLPSTQAFIPGI